jgi:uncharacterized protein YaaW (UPF0174 family)
MTSPNGGRAAAKSLPDALTTPALGAVVIPVLARGVELYAAELREKGVDLIAGPVIAAAKGAVAQAASYAGVTDAGTPKG